MALLMHCCHAFNHISLSMSSLYFIAKKLCQQYNYTTSFYNGYYIMDFPSVNGAYVTWFSLFSNNSEMNIIFILLLLCLS